MNDDQGNPLRASHLFSSLYSDPTWKTKNLYHAFDILELPTFTFPVSIVLLSSSDFAPQSVPLSGPVLGTAPGQRWLHSQPWNATEFPTRPFNFLVGWFPRPQWKSWRTISQRWLMAVVSHGLMTISLLFSSVSPMISVSRQKRDAMCSMWEPTLLHLWGQEERRNVRRSIGRKGWPGTNVTAHNKTDLQKYSTPCINQYRFVCMTYPAHYFS